MTARCLVVAKAPVAGSAKTRLGLHIGMEAAAQAAAAALLDSVAACTEAFGADSCHLALDGSLADGVDGATIARSVRGWTIVSQGRGDLGRRLAHAHLEIGPGPVVQIGMDTPQVRAALLREIAADLEHHDAVLGPAEDGGWWALALRDPQDAAVLIDVPMSTPDTLLHTRDALEAAGLDVGTSRTLRDIDTLEDAEAVAQAIPDSHFGRTWSGSRGGRR